MEGADRLKMTILPGDRVNRRDAATYLGRKPSTLGNWVKSGRGPKPVMIGGRAFYSLADLDTFIGASSSAITQPPTKPGVGQRRQHGPQG
jgi:predicted DNA-binding transcriptional regulator AlpA